MVVGRSDALRADPDELRLERDQVQPPGREGHVRRLEPRADRVRVTVADTGIGIPADKQDKLFQPFQRAGQETGPIEGTGIGLVITKRLAELMGGDVGFRSAPGRGLGVLGRPSRPRSGATAPGAGRRVDRAGDASLATGGASRRALRRGQPGQRHVHARPAQHVREHRARDGADGGDGDRDRARARRPKVVIMDINLPGMSGLDALRVLRADARDEGHSGHRAHGGRFRARQAARACRRASTGTSRSR